MEFAKRRLRCSLLFWAVAALLIVVAVKFIPGAIRVSHNINGKELPIYSVETSEQKVAISFDAAWGNEDTQRILDILKKHDVHATFFMTGGWVEAYPEDVKALYEAGHELANHSETHPNMSGLSKEQQRKEIETVHGRVKELTGYEMTLFRPPYGDYNSEVVKTTREMGYYPIQWSVDSLDWKDYGTASIIDTVCNHKELKSGAIILCHNGAKYTADALDEVLTRLKEKGFEIVPVGELIYREKYHMDVTGRQFQD
ncbi:MAG: polysaccharide deacetylase family protein [Lachnospiraceae bacterium]